MIFFCSKGQAAAMLVGEKLKIPLAFYAKNSDFII
jgi:hypothetical protein